MPAASHPMPSPDRNHAPKRIASTTNYSVLSEFQVSLYYAQSTSLRESLGGSNQRDSKTSQACYGHPRFNLNLIRLFRFSLPLPVFGRLFLFLHPRDINLQPPHVPCYTRPLGQVRRCSSAPWCQIAGDPLPRSPSIISPPPPAHVSPRSPALPI